MRPERDALYLARSASSCDNQLNQIVSGASVSRSVRSLSHSICLCAMWARGLAVDLCYSPDDGKVDVLC